MKAKGRQVGLIFLGLVCLALAVPAALTWRQIRQERLNQDLIAAVKRNDTAAVVSVLKLGADANCRDEPPRNFSMWQTLMQMVRRRRSLPSHAPTPLLIALMGREIKGAPRRFSGAILYHLIEFPPENLPLLRGLLDHGAHVNQPDQQGNTPLWWAIDAGHVSTVHLLLERGANATATGLVVFAVRCVSGTIDDDESKLDTGMIADLLDHGANVNQMDESGWTPLGMATESDCVDVVRVLLTRNADTTLMSNTSTPLALARLNGDGRGDQIVHMLKAAGARE